MPGSLALILLFAVPLAAETAAVEQTEKCAIEGAVMAAGSGAPLARAEVTISRKDASGPTVAVTTDAAGHYSVDGLEPGRYSLYVDRNGYVPQDYGQRGRNREGITLILKSGKRLRDIDFRLIAAGVITGRVLGEGNEPRVGAEVDAFTTRYIEGQRHFIIAGQAQTDDLGDYRIFGLRPGYYYVSTREHNWGKTTRRPEGAPPEKRYVPIVYPSAPDFEHATIIDVQPGGEVRGIDIVAVKSQVFHIRGKVLGFDPTTSDARVSLQAVGMELEKFGRDTETDRQGKFDFGGITPGSYALSAILLQNGVNTASRLIEVGNADVKDVSLAPIPGMQLSGHVVVEGDKKIDFSRLSVDLSIPYLSMRPSAHVSSDGSFVFHDAGHYVSRFEISGLPEDFYLKSVRLGGEEVAGTSIDLSSAGGLPGALEIVLSGTGGQVHGQVKDENDEPASGATVVLIPDSTHRGETALFKEATADRNGRFTMAGIRPGDYRLFAWDDVEPGSWWDPEFLSHYEEKGERVKIEANGSLSVDLRLISANPE
jgi:protocatechuate 3,4-dioxygenase beta subunit